MNVDVYDPETSTWKEFDDSISKTQTEQTTLSYERDSYLLFYIHDSVWPRSQKEQK